MQSLTGYAPGFTLYIVFIPDNEDCRWFRYDLFTL
ncbi:Hypothetical protein Cp106_0049 [Corynebacterium pseudotuberculosis 1/06-A]|nr:Hypothetical protein Cp106_0049 [Corynebacterium pseudotuberculosis 1/06-A]